MTKTHPNIPPPPAAPMVGTSRCDVRRPERAAGRRDVRRQAGKMKAVWSADIPGFRRLTLRSATGTAQRAIPTKVGTSRCDVPAGAFPMLASGIFEPPAKSREARAGTAPLRVLPGALKVRPISDHGNGNVAALVNATDGTMAAQYEYDPFGQVLRVTGPLAGMNPFRFSTKYQDDETGLNYYGYRFYNPNVGRWMSRDLIGEQGGVNLYSFIGNNPVQYNDFNGLKRVRVTIDSTPKGWDPHAPSDDNYITDPAQVLTIAKAAVGDKYDITGECGNCIKTLILASHGGGGGEFNIASLNYSATSYAQIPNRKALGMYNAWLDTSEAKAILNVHDILSELAALRCEHISITILACDAGEGAQGHLLRQQILDVFGPNTEVITYGQQCGFSPLFHDPHSSLDPFQTLRIAENNNVPEPLPPVFFSVP